MNRGILVFFWLIPGWFHSLYAMDSNPTNSIPRQKVAASQSVTHGGASSSFELDRDPFWPVGYEPGDPLELADFKTAEPEAIAKSVPWPELRVLGFIRSEKSQMAL